MEEFNLVLLIIIVLYLFVDFQNKKDMHESIKMKILAIINLIFIITVVGIILYDNSGIVAYLWLLIPLAIISAIYQYFRFIKSESNEINKYIFLIVNYAFIIILFFIL
jgi:hypothetical protein